MGNTGFLFGLVQLVLQMCHLAQAGFVFIAALEAGNNRPDIKSGELPIPTFTCHLPLRGIILPEGGE